MPYIIFIAAIIVNGATDAANAITGAVAGGALSLKKASLLAAIMNFFGMTVFYIFCPGVSDTIEGISALSGGGGAVVTSVLLSVVIWSSGAWFFGIPTSESHGLVAGMAGAAAAMGAKTSFLSREWIFVFGGVLLSSVLAAIFGGIVSILLNGRQSVGLTIIGCLATSFLHGAQDGQKFMALAVSCAVFRPGIFTAILCAAVMGLGTMLGGGRIVRKMGCEMTQVDMAAAVSSDLGSAFSLLLVTAAGMPASTTQVKACSLAGAAGAVGRHVDVKLLLSMVLAWVTTFPACYLLSFIITKLVL